MRAPLAVNDHLDEPEQRSALRDLQTGDDEREQYADTGSIVQLYVHDAWQLSVLLPGPSEHGSDNHGSFLSNGSREPAAQAGEAFSSKVLCRPVVCLPRASFGNVSPAEDKLEIFSESSVAIQETLRGPNSAFVRKAFRGTCSQ